MSHRHDGRHWAVLGGSGCGVSTALATVASALLAQDRQNCVVTARAGAWEVLRPDPRILWCDDPGRVDELVALRRQVPDLAVLVDDADQLLGGSHCPGRPRRGLVVGAKADAVSLQYRGLAVTVARQRTGILLGPPNPTAADLLGARVPVDP